MKALPRYLRVHRRRSALDQTELAYLLGFKSRSTISRHEHKRRRTTLRVAFKYQILFDAAPSELYPRSFAHAEEEIVRRAYELYQRLEGSTSKKGKAKLEFLKALLGRASRRHKRMAV